MLNGNIEAINRSIPNVHKESKLGINMELFRNDNPLVRLLPGNNLAPTKLLLDGNYSIEVFYKSYPKLGDLCNKLGIENMDIHAVRVTSEKEISECVKYELTRINNDLILLVNSLFDMGRIPNDYNEVNLASLLFTDSKILLAAFPIIPELRKTLYTKDYIELVSYMEPNHYPLGGLDTLDRDKLLRIKNGIKKMKFIVHDHYRWFCLSVIKNNTRLDNHSVLEYLQ